MAKRISSFTKEYDGLENSKVIELLNSHGIVDKKAQSGISEEEESLIKKDLSSLGYKKAGQAKESAPSVAKQPEKVEEKVEEKVQPTLKRKNIIIVGNSQNRNQQRNQQNNRNGGGQYHQQRNDNRYQRPNGPIKPRENMVDRAAAVSNKLQQEEMLRQQEQQRAEAAAAGATAKAEAAKEVKTETPVKTENTTTSAPAPVKTVPVTSDNTNTSRPSNYSNQGGYRNNQNSNRPAGNNTQGGYNRPNGGYNNNQSGYRGNNQSGTYNNNNNGDRQGGYNRPQGGYNNNQGGYRGNNQGGNNQGGTYNNNNGDRQGGYNRPQGGYNNNQGGYRGNNQGGNNQGSTYNNNSGYNRPQGGYNNNQGGYRGNNQGGTYNNSNGERQGGYRGNSQGGGYNNTQGGYRGNSQGGGYRGGQGGGVQRRDDGDNRFRRPGSPDQRGFQRPGAKPGSKPFGREASLPEAEKHRERNTVSDKDKRSRKDAIYEDDSEFGKGRNNAAGRFIKPEKKSEVVEEEEIKLITLPDEITIKDLADKMKIQPSAIVKKLFLQGELVTVNQEISFERAEEIALEYEIMCEKEVKVDVIAELLKEEDEDTENLISRPPVICVMGHVDHGKTSLLDAIRKTNVTDREAGGITQHIGAYMVTIKGRQITFLDTPGHEAFTSMRMRGANATDIAILVVAADDGVMPQTVEAINHAKAAGIEIVVAVNKIDKPGANIDRVKQELTEYELVAEDWGGSTIFAPVSAKTGEGIEELLEMILLSADVLELKSNPERQARGLVIEAELDKGRGPVATVLVQKGTLHVGDFISAGASHGKVRAMVDDKGRRVKEALPSTPVEILGLNDVPNAGEIFICHENDKLAKSFAETFIAQNKVKLLEDTKAKMSLDDLFSKIQEGNLKELDLIIKADVQGSVEAVKQSLLKLSNEEVVVKVIHGGVGAINESDVILASASNAIIIGFNVRPDVMAKQTAEREGVDMRLYKVIYQAIEDIEAAMKGLLDPVFEEKVIGHAEVRQIFKASAVGNIAGAFVLDGEFKRGNKVRITREGNQIFEGELASLKRFKDDVKEVKAGFECGLVFDEFDQIQELDMVEAYIMVEVPR